MRKIAITGGIAAGKTTVCRVLIAQYHIPIFDADSCVHRLYSHPDVDDAMRIIAPNCVVGGQVDRQKLAQAINSNLDLLEEIEDFIHPMVRQCERDFERQATRQGCKLVISDIPLLFEKGVQNRYDASIVVHAPLWLRERRAMMRTNMNAQKWRTIIANQCSDAERLKRADFVIETSLGRAHTMIQIKQIMERI